MKQYNYLKYQSVCEQTYVLSLDPKFKPLKNGDDLFYIKHEYFNFKGGEPSIRILAGDIVPDKLIITHRYNDASDMIKIVLAVDAAKRMGFKDISLILPYFPAARQDRVCNSGEALTVKVFAGMINTCRFCNVVILSPHSEVTPALLDNVVVLDELAYIKDIISDNSNESEFNIVCPDAGAGKRVGKVTEFLSKEFPNKKFNLIRCEKVRNVENGQLEGFYVQSEDLGGFPSIIVDDIVCIGGTFKGLAEKLRERNCGKLMLFTSHADCIEGVENMSRSFDRFYTTNSKNDWNELVDELVVNFKCFKVEL